MPRIGRHAGIDDAGDAGRVIGLLDLLERREAVGVRQRRHMARDRLEGRHLEQDAGRLAGLGVALDAAARRLGRVAADAGDGERLAVGDRGVADARQVDRAVGAGGVELLARRIALFLEIDDVPALAADDPRRLGMARGVVADARLDVGDAGGARQIDDAALDAGPEHVVVGVDETRQHRAVGEADLARAGTGGVARLGERGDRDDAVAPHRHRLGARPPGVHRDDGPPDDRADACGRRSHGRRYFAVAVL